MWNDTDIYDEETGTLYGYGEDDYTCPHGTYIGTPGGPDILCGWCEEGISREEFKEIMRQRRADGTREKAYIYAMHFLVDGTWQTFAHIPGNTEKDDSKKHSALRWLNEVHDEIWAMSDSDLVLIEDVVYRGYGH